MFCLSENQTFEIVCLIKENRKSNREIKFDQCSRLIPLNEIKTHIVLEEQT